MDKKGIEIKNRGQAKIYFLFYNNGQWNNAVFFGDANL